MALRACSKALAFAPRGRQLHSTSVVQGRIGFGSSKNDPFREREVVVDYPSNIARITLNRPKAFNALNLSMIRTLYPLYLEWEDNENIKMVLMTGEGEKAFCAGGDIRALYDNCKDQAVEYKRDFFGEEYRLNSCIGTYSKPHVCFIDGITMGGGVGLSVHGGFRVATERTMFAMPETGIGFFPDVGGTYFLPRLEGNLGMYLALTGARLKGADTLYAGVATHLVPSVRLDDLQGQLSELEDYSPEVISDTISDFAAEPLDAVIAEDHEAINKCFGADSVEEIVMRLEADGSEWATKTLKTLKRVSPTSLKVTFRGVRSGARMETLDECLKMEYAMAWEFMNNKDFFEGVRSVLVDKDNSPVWSPATLEDVREEDVDKYFVAPSTSQ